MSSAEYLKTSEVLAQVKELIASGEETFICQALEFDCWNIERAKLDHLKKKKLRLV